MAFDFVLARLAPNPSCFNIYASREDAQADMARANAREPEHPYAVMTWSEYDAGTRDFWIGNAKMEEITAEKYDDALNVLPPVRWEQRDGVERFMMSEFLTKSYTQQYARWQTQYFTMLVDAKDPTTWITAAKIVEFLKPKK